IDSLINNAGVNFVKPTLAMDEADWDRVLDVDLKGTFLCSRYALAHMAERRQGNIVNIASVHTLATLPEAAPYAAAKGGVEMMTKALAIEFAPYGIRVNAVSPGLTDTQIWADRRRRPGSGAAALVRQYPAGPRAKPARGGKRGAFPGLRRGELCHRRQSLQRRRHDRALDQPGALCQQGARRPDPALGVSACPKPGASLLRLTDGRDRPPRLSGRHSTRAATAGGPDGEPCAIKQAPVFAKMGYNGEPERLSHAIHARKLNPIRYANRYANGAFFPGATADWPVRLWHCLFVRLCGPRHPARPSRPAERL
ncbi:MAG: hypothetical protein DCC57_15470, partial [Chloroflexi bacterium]